LGDFVVGVFLVDVDFGDVLVAGGV